MSLFKTGELVMKNVYLVGLSVVFSMSVFACAANTDQEENDSQQQRSEELNREKNRDLKPAPNPNPVDPPAPAPAPGPLCQPLKGPGGGPGIGLANPASVYCAELGYKAEDSTCTFNDGTSCEQWSFWRGECGQKHSFCARQGGELSVKTQDEGGPNENWTSTFALCTLPTGASCKEQDFASTCKCE
jgi:putative hemolysin